MFIVTGLSLFLADKETIILQLSIAFAFFQFCVIVLVSLIKSYHIAVRRDGYHSMDDQNNDNIVHERENPNTKINTEMVPTTRIDIH